MHTYSVQQDPTDPHTFLLTNPYPASFKGLRTLAHQADMQAIYDRVLFRHDPELKVRANAIVELEVIEFLGMTPLGIWLKQHTKAHFLHGPNVFYNGPLNVTIPCGKEAMLFKLTWV